MDNRTSCKFSAQGLFFAYIPLAWVSRMSVVSALYHPWWCLWPLIIFAELHTCNCYQYQFIVFTPPYFILEMHSMIRESHQFWSKVIDDTMITFYTAGVCWLRESFFINQGCQWCCWAFPCFHTYIIMWMCSKVKFFVFTCYKLLFMSIIRVIGMITALMLITEMTHLGLPMSHHFISSWNWCCIPIHVVSYVSTPIPHNLNILLLVQFLFYPSYANVPC